MPPRATVTCTSTRDADLDAAEAIVLNAKLQRPGVCNAAETLLVHSRVADSLLPGLLRALSEAGVTLHGDDRAQAAAAGVPIDAASDEDWDTEYLALELAVGVVDSVGEAIEHINRPWKRSLRGDPDARHGRRARVRAGRRRRVRVRQRLDPIHRRRRVRDGRRDRELDAEAPCPWPDRNSRAVHLQVPGRGCRPRPPVSRASI